MLDSELHGSNTCLNLSLTATSVSSRSQTGPHSSLFKFCLKLVRHDELCALIAPFWLFSVMDLVNTTLCRLPIQRRIIDEASHCLDDRGLRSNVFRRRNCHKNACQAGINQARTDTIDGDRFLKELKSFRQRSSQPNYPMLCCGIERNATPRIKARHLQQDQYSCDTEMPLTRTCWM
jgi:hypothetical protein